MKRFFTLVLLVLVVLYALAGCGCDNGAEADLVFVNGSNMDIAAVLVDFKDQSSGAQNADSSPLRRGESFGFEAGEYPATVMVYDRGAEDFNKTALARLTIDSAPPEGERWYVTARDGGNGLTLSVDTRWPEGVRRVEYTLKETSYSLYEYHGPLVRGPRQGWIGTGPCWKG